MSEGHFVMDSGIAGGLSCLVLIAGLMAISLGLARHGRSHSSKEMRTRTGVVMGHVYDPLHFRNLDYVIRDDGQNRPEIVVASHNPNPNLLLIEGEDGLTVLEIGSESDMHGNTAPLN
jgi:hypothetical protein